MNQLIDSVRGAMNIYIPDEPKGGTVAIDTRERKNSTMLNIPDQSFSFHITGGGFLVGR